MATGLDPTEVELGGIASVDDARAWTGVSDEVFTGLQAVTGPINTLREIVLIPQTAWDTALAAVMVLPPTPAAAEEEPPPEPLAPRAILPVETGHVGSLRRVARLRLGLAADLVPAANVQQPAPIQAPLGQPSNLLGGLQQRRVKMASIIDQGDDSEIVPLDQERVRKLMSDFRKLNDDQDPEEDEEITGEQLGCLDSLLQGSRVPYADFAIFRPYGARVERQMKFIARVLNARGEWVNKEIAGPPDFGEWGKCYKVYRTGLLTLKAVRDARIRGYHSVIADLNAKFGAKYWWVVAQADIKMRSEGMEKIYRRALIEDAELVASGIATGLKNFDAATPWDYVFRMAAGDTRFWDKEVKDKVMLHAVNLVGVKDLLLDGTGDVEMGTQLPTAPGGGSSGSGGGHGGDGSGGGGAGAKRRVKKKGKKGTGGGGSGGGGNAGGGGGSFGGGGGGKGAGGKGMKGGGKANVDSKLPDGRFRFAKNAREICWKFNHNSCPDGGACLRMHVCEFCREKTHQSITCPSKPPGWVPP